MNLTPIHCPDSGCYWSAHGIPDQYTQARDWHLAAHRVEEHGETLTPEQIAYATRAGHVIPGTARTTAAAVAAQGALPVPVGDQPQPLGHATPAETVPALMATIKELRDLRAPLINALHTVYQSMTSCVGDEWAMEWLGEVWTQIPLDIRALAGDEDAAAELAAVPTANPAEEATS